MGRNEAELTPAEQHGMRYLNIKVVRTETSNAPPEPHAPLLRSLIMEKGYSLRTAFTR